MPAVCQFIQKEQAQGMSEDVYLVVEKSGGYKLLTGNYNTNAFNCHTSDRRAPLSAPDPFEEFTWLTQYSEAVIGNTKSGNDEPHVTYSQIKAFLAGESYF